MTNPTNPISLYVMMLKQPKTGVYIAIVDRHRKRRSRHLTVEDTTPDEMAEFIRRCIARRAPRRRRSA